MGNFWLAFITGLTTGGVSCFAVQGGLLTSALVDRKKKGILMFLSAKLFAYLLLGLVLGFLGSEINISPKFQGLLQIFVGVYMLATAGRLLNLHPAFRYLVIQPPKAFLRLLRKSSQTKSSFTPAVLGFLTILIPCGVTQAMMFLAIGTANPLWAAGIMFFFVLGTSPVFFLIGLAAVELLKKKALSVVAAAFIAIMGIFAINSGQILRGSVHTIQNYWKVFVGEENASNTSAEIKNGVQEVTIFVANNGYRSDVDSLKINVPVRLTLVSQGVRSCAKAFAIPEFNIFKVLSTDGEETIEFTPTKIGTLTYTCSMGMYTGSFKVIQ